MYISIFCQYFIIFYRFVSLKNTCYDSKLTIKYKFKQKSFKDINYSQF